MVVNKNNNNNNNSNNNNNNNNNSNNKNKSLFVVNIAYMVKSSFKFALAKYMKYT